MCHGHCTQDELDCEKVGVFFQIGLKETKSSVRDSRTRSARASHALRACEAREKKPTVRFPYNEFVVTRGLKNVVELSKIYSQLRPLCKFDTPGDWFRERIARVTFVCTWLRIFWKIKMSGSDSTRTKACSCSSKREKTELKASDNCRMGGCCFKAQFGNFNGGTQREYSSKPLKQSIVKRTLVFKR